MADESSFDKAKAFLQQNWETHRQAFGPILEPAFEEDLQARLRLIVALNHLSQRQCLQARQILLKELKTRCQNDHDLAAWRFFMGLSFEMEGNQQQMCNWYIQTCKLNHGFFMPHLKLAKYYHGDMSYDLAVPQYRIAIDLLKKETDRDLAVLGAAYANLTGCLTMMHNFNAAEDAWYSTVQYPLQPSAYAAASMLYAAKGDREKAEAYLGQIDEKYEDLISGTAAAIEKVCAKQHPHFTRLPTDPQKIEAFWKWFAANEEQFTGRSAKVIAELAQQLHLALPFLPHAPRFKIERKKTGFRVSFRDFYSVATHYGLGDLLKACPKNLQLWWIFTIIH